MADRALAEIYVWQSTTNLAVYSDTSFDHLRDVPIASVPGSRWRVLRWGVDGLILHSSTDIAILDGVAGE